MERVDRMLARLKALDSRATYPEVQQALKKFVEEWERSLTAVKQGRREERPELVEARRRLMAEFAKHE
jgi:hypothetical protein